MLSLRLRGFGGRGGRGLFDLAAKDGEAKELGSDGAAFSFEEEDLGFREDRFLAA